MTGRSELTYAEIEQSAFGDFTVYWEDEGGCEADEEKVRQRIEEIASESTPSMTTVLFMLVVFDNSLAFEEADTDGNEPFRTLSDAINRKLATALTERWQAHVVQEDEVTLDES